MPNLKNAVFFGKYSLLKPNAVKAFRQALRNQYLSRDELNDLNWQQTCRLLQYAYDNTAFYRNRFDKIGLHPKDIRHPDDYAKVPVLKRQDLQDHFQDLVSREARPKDLRLSTTGGSTGEPAKVYHQKKVVRAAMGWRLFSWWGLGPGDDMASVYRDMRTDWKGRAVNFLTWWPTRRIFLNAAALDSPGIAAFLEEYNRVRPRLLHGYVGAVDHLASYILDNGITVPAPKAIWVTSAPLNAVQEHRISQAFGAPVYDQYGSCEVYWLAAECPAKNGLHMFYDTKTIEFLDDRHQPCKTGELGEIAVTDLENMYFPLIRYLNGDMGRALPHQCACGVTLPLMDKVKGRTTDKILLPDGTHVAGDYMTTIFDDFPDAVKQFQVHQYTDYSIEITVVPNLDSADIDNTLAVVRKRFETHIDKKTTVTLSKADDIQQTGGKLRFVESELR
jgi:phenylacetate-CoA ligase